MQWAQCEDVAYETPHVIDIQNSATRRRYPKSPVQTIVGRSKFHGAWVEVGWGQDAVGKMQGDNEVGAG
eukprot:120259-Pyramimonas_sp.AAC.1